MSEQPAQPPPDLREVILDGEVYVSISDFLMWLRDQADHLRTQEKARGIMQARRLVSWPNALDGIADRLRDAWIESQSHTFDEQEPDA